MFWKKTKVSEAIFEDIVANNSIKKFEAETVYKAVKE